MSKSVVLPNCLQFGRTVLPNCVSFCKTVSQNGVLNDETVLPNKLSLKKNTKRLNEWNKIELVWRKGSANLYFTQVYWEIGGKAFFEDNIQLAFFSSLFRFSGLLNIYNHNLASSRVEYEKFVV